MNEVTPATEEPMIQTPYLIQRAEIHRPLRAGRLSQAVQLDYMGSAEFEFGALPSSLRTLQAQQADLIMTVESVITDQDRSLRVLHSMTPEQYQEYLQHLLNLRKDKIRTKETTRFAAGFPQSKYGVTDFWWDIDNHVMWSFDKIFMNRLQDTLKSSWQYMDDQRAMDRQ